MIDIQNLTKYYGKHKAVDDVSFSVEKGSVLGFLGPNGAGKSTVMNMITGYLSPTDGKITVDGLDVTENSLEVRKKIGYLPELPPLYMDMTVKEYLDFIAEAKGFSGKAKKEAIDDAIYTAVLGEVPKRLIRNLSKGYKQRVGFAQAVLGRPEILILDEPTVGLDPKQVVEFRKIIATLGRNHTIILSTHILQEVEAVCSDVVIINNGKIAKAGSLSSFKGVVNGEKRFVVTLDTDRDSGAELLKSIPEIKFYKFARIDRNASLFTITADEKADANKAIFRACAEHNIDLLEMKTMEKSLEEEFVSIISQGEM